VEDGTQGGIEELIGRPTYFKLVNLCYKLPRKMRLRLMKPEVIEDVAGQPKHLAHEVEKHFAACGSEAGTFDRYRPAEFLAENTRKCEKKLPELSSALDRFEKLFADINACS